MSGSNYNADSSNSNKELESYTMSVGISFVNAYYKQLGEDPAGLASFFAADSAFTWSDDENNTEPVGATSFGRDAIVQRLKTLHLERANVHINSVMCQPSANHSVLVQVVGDITPSASEPKKQYTFVQVFYLVKVAHKFRYYCYNDCFRYISLIKEEEPVKAEEPEYKPQAQPTPASPQRHEGNILGGSDPIAPASHSGASAGVIGPASSASSTSSAPTTAPKTEEASPVNLSSQFSGGQYGAIGQNYTPAEQPSTNNDWAAEDEEPEVVSTPEPEPTPAPVAAPPARQEQKAAAPQPAAKKGWAAVEKPQPVPISQQQQKQSPTPQQAAAAAPVAQQQQEESDDDNGKPVSFLEAIKRKQRKAAQAAPVTVVQAPATAVKKQDDSAGARAKLAQERKEYEAREAAARRPREQPERRPREQTPRFGVFVGKMPSEALENDVKEVFGVFGKVANVRIPQGKRVAFVDFETEAGHNAAIAAGKASVLGQQVVITEPQPNPGQGGQQGGQKQGGQGGKGAQGGKGDAKPKVGAKTGKQ